MKNLFLFMKQGIKSIFKNRLEMFILIALTLLSVSFFTSALTTYSRMNDSFNDLNESEQNIDYYSYSPIFQSEVIPSNIPSDNYSITYDLLPSFLSTSSQLDRNELYLNDDTISFKFPDKTEYTDEMELNPFTTMYSYDSLKKYINGVSEIKYDTNSSDYIPNLVVNTNIFNVDDYTTAITNEIMATLKAGPNCEPIDQTYGSDIYNAWHNSIFQYSLIAKLVEKNPDIVNNNNFITFINYITTSIANYINNALTNWIETMVNNIIDVFNNGVQPENTNTDTYDNAYDVQKDIDNNYNDGDDISNNLFGNSLPFYIIDDSNKIYSNNDDSNKIDALKSSGDENAKSLWEYLSTEYITGMDIISKNNEDNKTISNTSNIINQYFPEFKNLSKPIFNNNNYQYDFTTKNTTSGNSDSLIAENIPTNSIVSYSNGAHNATTMKTNSSLRKVSNDLENNDGSISTWGTKGLSTPIYNYLSETKNDNIVVSWNYDFTNSSDYIDFESGYLTLANSESIYQNYELHKIFVAEASNFSINNSDSLLINDNSNDKKYQLVSIANDITNFKQNDINGLTIYQGNLPTRTNQIVVSPGYAKLNNVKIGDWIWLGTQSTSPLQISGIGIDPLKFYPVVDPSVPIPDVKNQAIIYAYESQIRKISSTLSGAANSYQTSFYTYIGNDEKQKTNDYNALLAYNATSSAYSNQNFLYQYQYNNNLNSKKTESSLVSSLDPNSEFNEFKNSNIDQLNNQLYPEVTFYFLLGIIVIVTIILIVCLISTFILVRNSINKNLSQISTIKALGVKKRHIVSSYIFYPLLIFITIPIGWLIGIFLQFIFVYDFSNLFSIPYNSIYFNWSSLGYCFIIVFGLNLIMGIWTTLSVIKKDTIKIMKSNIEFKDTKFSKVIDKWYKNRNFKIRFKAKLASTSIKKLIIMGITITFSSITISLSMIVPSILTTISNSYYKEENFKNSIDYKQPIFNFPLSKPTVNIWDGPDAYESDWINNPSTNKTLSTVEPYIFNNINDYIANGSESSPIPFYLYDYKKSPGEEAKTTKENSYKWTWDELSSSGTIKESNLIQLISNALSNFNGKGFSNAWFEYAEDWFLSNNKYDISTKSSEVNAINTLMKSTISTVLSQILNYNPNNKDKTWEDVISNAILNQTPLFVRQYMTSSLRKELFTFGWNIVNIIKNKDTMITKFENPINDQFTTNIVGLPKGQENIFIDSNLNKQLYDNNIVEQFKKLINNSQTTGTINVPVVASKSSQIHNDLSIGQIVKSTLSMSELQFKNKNHKFEEIDPSWWRYDDSDYETGNYSPNTLPDPNNKKATYLNLNNIDTSKFISGNPIISLNNGNKALASFTSYSYDEENNKIVLKNRPYYENKNIELWIPQSDINISDWDNPYQFANNDNSTYKKYKDSNGKKWYIFYPFAYILNKNYNNNEGIKLFTGLFMNWYDEMQKNGTFVVQPFVKNGTNSTYVSPYSSINHNITINYKIIGFNKVYNDDSLYTNQEIANLILNYPTNKLNYFQYTPGTTTNINNGSFDENDTDPNYSGNLAYSYNNNQLSWFTGKLSNVTEPYDISTYFSSYDSDANFSINGISTGKINSNITNQELLSTKEGFLKQMTDVGISMTTIFIINILVCSIILVLLISILFVNQNQRFMALMKTLGYKKREINKYMLSIFTPIAICSYIFGYGLTFLLTQLIIYIVQHSFHVAIPYSYQIWTLFASFAIVAMIYIFTYIYSTYKIKRFDINLVNF